MVLKALKTLKAPKKLPVKYATALLVVVLLTLAVVLVVLAHGHNFAVFDAKGQIAAQQRNLFLFASILSLGVVLPVFAMTFFIVWKYREGKKAEYRPEWEQSALAETVWWGLPTVLIIVLSIVTWNSSHHLDPFRPLESNKKPLKVQVVALQWKWLFIYPEQNIATVNYVRIPEDTPVDFEITSDAPMNSFWIPQLGGQVYAMSGMSTHLHLMADAPGVYRGTSANISGFGFANMKFKAESVTDSNFAAWVQQVKASPKTLDKTGYLKLAKPDEKMTPVAYYASLPKELYDSVVMKYMAPGHTAPHMDAGPKAEHNHHETEDAQ
jgi:cytochrome o ubiquinol oxidase subunit II